MQIINDGLPDIIYEYLKTDFYDTEVVGDSLSATTLLKPVQEVVLTRRHKDKIVVKASDRIWSLFGSSIHAVLEKGFDGKYEQEQRHFKKVKGMEVSGKFDLLKDNIIHDFKVTSAFTVMYNSRIDEWTEQLSIYRWLMYPTRIVSDEGRIIAILRDWTVKNAYKPNYPKSPIIEIPLKLMDYKATEAMVTKSVTAIKKALKLLDEQLPECTNKERWYNPRTDEFNKCSKYCQARDYCQQLKRYLEEPCGSTSKKP